MKKRISLLLLAAALTFGLNGGSIAQAQPPLPEGHFPGDHNPGPDVKVPDGKNIIHPDVQNPGKEMREDLRKDKKDFQDRVKRGKKELKEKKKFDKKFDKRGGKKDFRPEKHKGKPDFQKPDHAPQPGDSREIPDFGQQRK